MELTVQQEQYLDDVIEEFLNKSLFSADILNYDNEELDRIIEHKAIQYVIETLSERISYY